MRKKYTLTSRAAWSPEIKEKRREAQIKNKHPWRVWEPGGFSTKHVAH